MDFANVTYNYPIFFRILLEKILELIDVIEEPVVAHETVVGVISRLGLLLQTVVTVRSQEESVNISKRS